jgi:hypothetical protein
MNGSSVKRAPGLEIRVRCGSPRLRESKAFALYVRQLLGTLVSVNCLSLMLDPSLPNLYDVGVRFKPEPKGYESFVDLYHVLDVGVDGEPRTGDCAHLAAWRCAELIVREGVRASLRVIWMRDPRTGLRVFHVIVRRPPSMRYPLGLEDPSAKLGMRSVRRSVAA